MQLPNPLKYLLIPCIISLLTCSLDNHIFEHSGFFSNGKIERHIHLTDHTEIHSIHFKIISKPDLGSKEPYLLFLPTQKTGRLTSIKAECKLSIDSNYIPIHLSPSVHSKFSFNGIEYQILEVELTSTIPSSSENLTTEYDLKIHLKYIKPFKRNPIEMPRSETHTNLLYTEYSGVFSIYKTNLMITKLDYWNTSGQLMRYTGSEIADTPISYHAESKELVYGPYKDLVVPVEDNEESDIQVIDIIFKTTRAIPEIESFERIIRYGFFNTAKGTVTDFFVLKNVSDNLQGMPSFERNLRILRVHFGSERIGKVIKESKQHKMIYNKDSKTLLVKFDKEVKPQEEVEVSYSLNVFNSSVNMMANVNGQYFKMRRIVVEAPLFRKIKKIKSKRMLRIKQRKWLGIFNTEYGVYEDHYIDAEEIPDKVLVVLELDRREISKVVVTFIGFVIGYLLMRK